MQIAHSDFQDQLVRGLTHRMNNILTLFHGYLGLLLDDQKLDPATLSGLQKIKEGARAASELMDRTHALARPSTLVWREIPLAEFLRNLRPGLEGQCGERTRLAWQLDGDAPAIWADAVRVKTAIVELIQNALEATAAGGRVEVRLETVPAGPGKGAPRVMFTVTDDGPGIAPEHADKIFLPFFTTKKVGQATGLGLTVAQEFVQQIGGTLRYTSEPGRTEFQIVFPARA